MTYYILVKPEAVKDIINWIANPSKVPNDWLVQRVRVVTQETFGWVTIVVNEDSFYQIVDNFNHSLIYSQYEL